MTRIIVAAVLLAAIAIAISPLISRGVTEFKTFLSLSSLLNPCDGAGSPPPCRK
jgi:hypothetical protein